MCCSCCCCVAGLFCGMTFALLVWLYCMFGLGVRLTLLLLLYYYGMYVCCSTGGYTYVCCTAGSWCGYIL